MGVHPSALIGAFSSGVILLPASAGAVNHVVSHVLAIEVHLLFIAFWHISHVFPGTVV
jgi:hypothetical protein